MTTPHPDGAHTRAGIEQHVRTQVGGIEWVRLLAGNGVMSIDQLAEYVEQVRRCLGPNAVVFIEEYELRAYTRTGQPTHDAPRIIWQ